ncbi:hypothetical protein V8F33_006794 [Rhypophila sp. PSN 637]
MNDFPTGGGSGSGNGGGGGGGGGGGWFRGYIQRSRTPTGGITAYEGGNGDDAPPAHIQGEFFSSHREQEWEQLDREREDQKRTEEHHDHGFSLTSPSKQHKSTHHRHGITLPQRVSSLLKLSTTDSGAGASNEQKGKISSHVKSFVPSGIDPRTPTENYWQIPAIASAAGPVYPLPGKGRKKSYFPFSNGEGDDDNDENDPDPLGYRRFPKVGQGRQPTGAWHNPNLMQIVESLQSAMMNKRDPMEHIPVVYNSYVLTLIEGFGKLTTRLKNTESELADLKNLREKELEQFRGISEEWILREDGYKAEIKRLELVLAKESKDGVASVAMARQTSLADRSGTKRFQARLKRMSGSHQEGIKEQPLAEEEETTSVAPTSSCFPTLGEMPRRIDTSQDVLASRMIEKLERHERARSNSDTGHIRKTHPAYHAADEYQKQNLQQVTSKKVIATDHENADASKTLRPAPHLKVNTRSSRRVDDGLTVGWEAHRSAGTVANGVSINPTGRVAAERQHGKFPHDVRRVDRRYSFSRGDDEVLPVIPSDTEFEDAGLRRVLDVQTGDASSARPAGTSGSGLPLDTLGKIPLSTSADSVGSVVWLGNSGNFGSSDQPVHQSVYVGSLGMEAGGGSRSTGLPISASVYSPEQAVRQSPISDLSGNALHPSRDAGDRTGSQSLVYASPTIRPVSNLDTSQMSEPSRRERPASPQAPVSHGVLSNMRSAEVSPIRVVERANDAARIAAARAVTRDGQQK